MSLDKQEIRQGNMVTPFSQAKKYADEMPNSKRPETIIVCHFTEFRIYDLDTEHPEQHYESFTLKELPAQLHLLQFLTDPQAARAKREKEVSLQAGELIGKLYMLLYEQYLDPDSTHAQHSLNVLCVRLVFCLYAEDAGIFPKSALHFDLNEVRAQNMRLALARLFKALDTPISDRDPYDKEFVNLPYVNGGLFADRNLEIPPFTEDMRTLLVNKISAGTDWSQISPTIFGGVFESTLNPETRHDGGMHYTSPENIHRVIDPLFLDELKEELEQILTEPGSTDRKRSSALKNYHEKIASLVFFEAFSPTWIQNGGTVALAAVSRGKINCFLEMSFFERV
ncbi:MAG: type IIL restriction-modification enzyme MmeI [Corynebacterium sp.]|nr:type IIL restriction-modification enzyme MmeI [Corynebacterium sp.]